MALSKIQAESMNLADTYAFSGTVSGTTPITHIDQWRLTQTFTGDTSPYLTANLERVDTNGGALLGSAMTQSSGAFTFPVTGLWQITFFGYHGSAVNNNDARTKIAIFTTLDNSSYTIASETSGNTHGTGGAAETGTTTTFVFNVTNVNNDKVKFSVDVFDGGNTSTFGSSVESLTGFTFIRLGDT